MAVVSLNGDRSALIDDADLSLIAPFKWRFFPRPGGVKGYVTAKDGSRMIAMHRLIMGAVPGQQIDHANGDGLDNRRANLRFCTTSQNAANAIRSRRGRSGFKNVAIWPNGDFVPLAESGGIRYRGAPVADAIEAAHQADAIIAVLHGEFARLNFPDRAPRAPPALTWWSYAKQRPPAQMRPFLQHQDPVDRNAAWATRWPEILREQEEAARREIERCAALVRFNAPVIEQIGGRNAEIIRRRLNGETLQSVADGFGLTRERVRQIVDGSQRLGIRLQLAEAA